MIRAILRKDWRMLWPLAMLVTAIQIALEWTVFKGGFFGADPAAHALLRPLTLAWFIGIAALAIAVVHEDPIPGVDQDWLIRPLKRADLLLAKLLFVFLTISVPMLIVNLTHTSALGFPFVRSLNLLLYKELYAFVCVLVPLVALASTTRNLSELLVLGAALMIAYATSLFLSALLIGADRCPTCETGIAWLQNLLQHAGVLIGAGVILFLQFFRRRTALTRTVSLLGAVALVAIQLPWNAAFALQRWLSDTVGVSTPGALNLVPQALVEAGDPEDETVGARQATRALLQGNVGNVAKWIDGMTRADRTVLVDLPVQISGVPADHVLIIDRAGIRILDANARELYHTVSSDAPGPVMTYGADPANARVVAHRKFELPAGIYQQLRSGGVRWQADYSLTLMALRAQHRMAAVNSRLLAHDLGLCATKVRETGVSVRCKQVGRAPLCYSVALQDAHGHHNPEVLKCKPDYRPYMPAYTDAVSFFGTDVPTRDAFGLARYEVQPADLGHSYLVLKVYGIQSHFKRTMSGEPARNARALE